MLSAIPFTMSVTMGVIASKAGNKALLIVSSRLSKLSLIVFVPPPPACPNDCKAVSSISTLIAPFSDASENDLNDFNAGFFMISVLSAEPKAVLASVS